VWAVIEEFSNLFYQPLIFWGVPFVLALLWEGIRAVQERSR